MEQVGHGQKTKKNKKGGRVPVHLFVQKRQQQEEQNHRTNNGGGDVAKVGAREHLAREIMVHFVVPRNVFQHWNSSAIVKVSVLKPMGTAAHDVG